MGDEYHSNGMEPYEEPHAVPPTGRTLMTWMQRVREYHHAFRDQVRANALDEGGLQPVAFLLVGDAVAPVVMAEAMGPEEIFSATDRLAREMGADAAVLAFEMIARRTDTAEAFRELVEDGALRPPSQSGDRTRAVVWHLFAGGRCEREVDVFEGGDWQSQGTTSLRHSPVPYFRHGRDNHQLRRSADE
jgi:hypothetical protein